MATYMKPTSKLFDLPSRGSGELNLTDLMCPVCRGILIEPVTLPCAHSLCLRCLNGTIQHNSLSCPLCRVRVGSWLRTATKSATLVNDNLWKFIKQRFAKEIKAKNDGVEADIESGFVTTTNKILSAAGEIRREYEAQLQLAEEEMRRRREAERIASEALIRKIQAEEREEISQLAKDNAAAKNLAKKNILDRNKPRDNNLLSEDEERREYRKSKDGGGEWDSNIALISKLRAESYAGGEMKAGVSVNSASKGNSETYLFQKFDEPLNSTGKSISARQQLVGNKVTLQNAQAYYMPKPGCSGSKIYGTQSKEELHVLSDVLNRKRKSLGVEVCLATGEDKERRIGSAESTGSHDSINIEIHHFKPIKAMPRTPLRTMPDGRQVDPKLIRVVAILKRVQNAVPKPPTLMQLKRLSGCSYSAFKGKSKKVLKQDAQRPAVTNLAKEDLDRRPSTSNLHNQPASSSNKLSTKSQISDTVRRLDLSAEISYDGNKNYTKNINRIINGTKVSKKLILDEDPIQVARVANKTATTTITISTTNTASDNHPGKFRRRKYNSSSNDREGEFEQDHQKPLESGDEASSSNSNSISNFSANNQHIKTFASSDSSSSDEAATTPAVENIAERIKKRKINRGRNHERSTVALKKRRVADKKTARFNTKVKNRRLEEEEEEEDSSDDEDEDEDKKKKNVNYHLGSSSRDDESIERIDSSAINSTRTNQNDIYSSVKRSTRNSAKVKSDVVDIDTEKINKTASIKSSRFVESRKTDNDIEEEDEEDDEGIREQKRMERLLIQEKKDFELAKRLQAKFDEMERISGRTRGSRRGGSGVVTVSGLNSKNIEHVLAAGNRSVRNDGVVGMKERFTKQLLIQNDDNSQESQNNKRRVTRRRCVQ